MIKVIIDYISGIEIKNPRPEEIYGTQPFSKLLVEDYGYPKECIATRPQVRIPCLSPDSKEHFADIIVYDDNKKNKIKIIVKVKRPELKLSNNDKIQLQELMNLSNSEFGVLYNGNNSVYLYKNENNEFEDIPAIPGYGEKLSEIGHFTRDKLKKIHNLKKIFSDIRGWIVANGNISRDETIANQIILLLLCKIYDEKYTLMNDKCLFRYSIQDTDNEFLQRINELFVMTQKSFKNIFEDNDKLEFNVKTLKNIVGRLQTFKLMDTERDVVADAFEVFIAKSVKESEGQFFTPRNVVSAIIAAIDIKETDKIIDPACGSGGFLVEALKTKEKIISAKAERQPWNKTDRLNEWQKAIDKILAIEKDPFLAKLSKSYMAILGAENCKIFREDSLDLPSSWQSETQEKIGLNSFDVLLVNPPFGKNIKVEGTEKLAQFSLAGKIGQKGKAASDKTGNVSTMFLERSFQFLKKGGKIGIILPEPYFALKSYKNCIDFMFKDNNILWVIDLPHNTFRPHNNAKCCAIIIEKGIRQQEYINMAVAENIGHDHQGKPVYRVDKSINDDMPQIIDEIIQERNDNNNICYLKPLTFKVKADDVKKQNILIPRFYWSNKIDAVKNDALGNNIELISLQTLLDEKIIEFFSGHGSPKSELKGKGNIPYIRVKDIVNWQVYVDVTALIPRSEYEKIFTNTKQLKPKDILYVSRGSYRIGSVAMVSPYDGEMLLTKEINVIRLKNTDNRYGITAEYLLYALSHKFVWEQTLNKIFYEPCLPNIENRWKEILIPIPKDKNIFEDIKNKVEFVINDQWKSKEMIEVLKKNFGVFMV